VLSDVVIDLRSWLLTLDRLSFYPNPLKAHPACSRPSAPMQLVITLSRHKGIYDRTRADPRSMSFENLPRRRRAMFLGPWTCAFPIRRPTAASQLPLSSGRFTSFSGWSLNFFSWVVVLPITKVTDFPCSAPQPTAGSPIPTTCFPCIVSFVLPVFLS